MTSKAIHILEKLALHPKTLRHASGVAFKKYLDTLAESFNAEEGEGEGWKRLQKKEPMKYLRQAKNFAMEARKRELKGISPHGPIGALTGALVGAAIPVGKIKKDSALDAKEKRQLHTISGALSGYLAGKGTEKLIDAYRSNKFMKNITKAIK